MQDEAALYPAPMIYPTPQKSWTDDLPVCKESGVGFSTNQIYREDNHRQEEHPFEDRSFHCKYDESTYLYAIFDGHDGVKVADFALQRMAAEILLGQLNRKTTDQQIREVLRQAFIAVESSYMDSIDDLIAERTSLQCDIPVGMNSYEAFKHFPEIVNKLKEINCKLSSSTSAIVVLMYNKKLYIANVGDSRALLCKTDENQVLKVVPLSVDHNLKNEDELLRLSQLGLDFKKMRQGSHLGNLETTRCLGNYLIKGGYKEFEELAPAVTEPIIAEPEIYAGIEIDESCRFLLLMSRGLYKALEQASGNEQVNRELALMAVEEFKTQSTLTGVAQAIVDKIVRIHHDVHMNAEAGASATGKRDDMTLLVRNFNFVMPKAMKPKIKPPHEPYDPFKHMVFDASDDEEEDEEAEASMSGESSTSTANTALISDKPPWIPGDGNPKAGPDGVVRIDPYVDFSQINANLEKRKKEGTLPKLPDGFDWF